MWHFSFKCYEYLFMLTEHLIIELIQVKNTFYNTKNIDFLEEFLSLSSAISIFDIIIIIIIIIDKPEKILPPSLFDWVV